MIKRTKPRDKLRNKRKLIRLLVDSWVRENNIRVRLEAMAMEKKKRNKSALVERWRNTFAT